MDDIDDAKAYNNETLKSLLAKHKSTTTIMICAVVILVTLSLVIVLMLLVVFFCSSTHSQSKWIKKVKKNRPKVLSLTILSFIANIYMLCLAITGVIFWEKGVKHDPLYSFERERNVGPLYFILVVDIICLFSWFVLALFAYCIKFCTISHQSSCTTQSDSEMDCNCELSHDQDHTYVILSLTVLCPLFCIIAHSPYIAIAYLNDGSHASSIFIYYSVISYVLFGLIWLFFHWCEQQYEKDMCVVCYNCFARFKAFAEDNGQKICCCTFKTTTVEENANKKFRGSGLYCGMLMISLVFAILLLFGLIVTVICYFVLIPITKSLSDAPN